MVDAHQPALWVDSFADALRDAVNAAGSPKRVAAELARLQREFTASVEAQRALVERMERLTQCKTQNKPRDIASARWP